MKTARAEAAQDDANLQAGLREARLVDYSWGDLAKKLFPIDSFAAPDDVPAEVPPG